MSKQDEQVAAGIAEVLERNGEDRYQWGQYIERNDGRDGRDDWIPLIYDGDEDTVRDWHSMERNSDVFRNSRIVKRAVGPWEVQS